MEFAREPARYAAALALFDRFAADSLSCHWLLVDAAVIDERTLRTVTTSLPLSNALRGSPFEIYGSQAPQMAALPPDRDTAVDMVTRLVAIDPRAPAVSIVWSSSSEAAVGQLFTYLAQATIDDDFPVHCRFADTRVLPTLLARLSARQAARVAIDVRGWSWIDHLGHVASWRPTLESPAVEADVDRHLVVSMLQLHAMLAASEPDTMFEMLLENTPELVPAEGRGRFRDRLSSILASADTRSVEAPKDRLQFVILSLGFGDAFHDDADLQATWRRMATRQMTLVEAMATWGDALWKRLELRRASRP